MHIVYYSFTPTGTLPVTHNCAFNILLNKPTQIKVITFFILLFFNKLTYSFKAFRFPLLMLVFKHK